MTQSTQSIEAVGARRVHSACPSLFVQLARSYQLSAYDAAYLELAIRRGLPLACLDGKLKTAAATGVVHYSPS